MERFLCGFVIVGALAGEAVQAQAQYTFTPLEDINPSARNTVATDINNLGQIVGFNQNTFTGFLSIFCLYPIASSYCVRSGLSALAFGRPGPNEGRPVNG
jgi:hypothetical protein